MTRWKASSEKETMSSSTNLSHLIEKKICRKFVHGAYNNTGTIETDCDTSESNFQNIFTEPNLKNSTKNKKDNSSVSVLKTDTAEGFCEDLTKMQGNEGSKGNTPQNEDEENVQSSITVESLDEIDYFDSDEEHLETCSFRFDEYNVLDEFDKFPGKSGFKGGRYSELKFYKWVHLF